MLRASVPSTVTHRIVFSPEARDDLRRIYVYIAARSGGSRALNYIDRVEAYCRSFSVFPERGTKRDDLLAGIRVTGFERRLAIAFHIDGDTVVFDRILYGGRDLSVLKPGRTPGP